MLIPQLEYDAELAFADLTPEFADWLARCAPFGIGNPEPTFLTRGAVVAAAVRLIQETHICLQLVPSGRKEALAIPALGWSRGAADWRACCGGLGVRQGSSVDVLYRIRRNTGPYASPNLGGLELELRALRLTVADFLDTSQPSL